jgi:prevent-host-death family protein
MIRLSVVELRQCLAEILNRAEYQGERVLIHRRGKDAAAIIPIEDLRLLERLIEDIEDRLDIEAARAALAESGDRIPYAEVRRKLGLEDEQKTPPACTGAGTRPKSRAKTV